MNQCNKHGESGRRTIDSGVEWVGEVPDGWEITILNRFSNIHLGKMLTPQQTSPNQREIPYLRAANLTGSSNEIQSMWATEQEIEVNRVQRGDVLVVEGGSVGFPLHVNGEVPYNLIIQNSVHRLRFFGHQRYGFWWMMFLYGSGIYSEIINSVSIAHLTKEKLERMPVARPPLPEQRAIASYLDHHVSLIDQERELISQKIDLLKDKRRAMIYEAVTGKFRLMKGEGEVRMVDSGVEWIGRVPDGWFIRKLKEASRRCPRPLLVSKNDEHQEGGIPVITPGELSGPGDGKSKPLGTRVHASQVAPRGATAAANIASIGKIRYLEEESVCNPQVVAYVTSENHRFFYYSMFGVMDEARSLANTTTIPFINTTDLGNIPLPVPPLPEQQAIASYLDHHVSLIDREIDLLSQKSDLLADKRKALIFEAVTGKLDVSA